MPKNIPLRLQRLINSEESQDLSSSLQDFACVALLIRNSSADLELAFIRRAENPLDGWGGQLAFPGGRKDPEDLTDLDTAIREVTEEVGLPLNKEACLGRLHDIQARQSFKLQAFYLRPFVFFLENSLSPKIKPDEVADFFWISFGHLNNPLNRTQISLQRNSEAQSLPAISIPDQPALWGLSLMILEDFLTRFNKGWTS
jgi:8-oxo-dGTP pyrophosphatase MutT (NUDIX family)